MYSPCVAESDIVIVLVGVTLPLVVDNDGIGITPVEDEVTIVPVVDVVVSVDVNGVTVIIITCNVHA